MGVGAGGETDEEEETERCGEEVKGMKKRDDRGLFRCRSGGFRPHIRLIQVVFSR